MLMDIATEELSHLEIIGTLVGMLNKGAKGALAEGVENEAELYRSMTENGNDSHITSLLYGGGTPLTNSAGVPWTAAYVDTIGEPTADLRSNVAAEARAKIIYERLINVMYVGFMGTLSAAVGWAADKSGMAPIVTLILFSAISLVCGFIYSKFIVFRDAK